MFHQFWNFCLLTKPTTGKEIIIEEAVFFCEIGFLPIWNKGLSQDHLKTSGQNRIELRLLLINCVKLEMHFGRLLEYRNHVEDMKCMYVFTYFFFFLLKKKRNFNVKLKLIHSPCQKISNLRSQSRRSKYIWHWNQFLMVKQTKNSKMTFHAQTSSV